MIEIDPEEWRRGFEDGAGRLPADPGAGHSYLSGWIEGDAKRRGFSYTNPYEVKEEK